MNCTCQADIEAKLLERFKAETRAATGHAVSLQGYGFGLAESKVVVRAFTEFKARATHTLKSGGKKQKTQTGYMHFSYCPFCGVKAATKETK